MTPISIAIITKNEAHQIADCLRGLQWAGEIVVVDSHSSDDTVRIAKEMGAKVHLRRFDNFADQKNFALSQCSQPWILSVDADERVPESLREETTRAVSRTDAADGYFVLRDNYFFGRCLRHAGQGQDRQMRLLRRGKARFKNVVHEEVVVDGRVGTLTERLEHHTCRDIAEYKAKLIQYTDLEVRQMRARGMRFRYHQILLRPWMRFIYTYFLRAGFLDGRQGLWFHALSAYYTFLKYDKLRRAGSATAAGPGVQHAGAGR